MIKYRKAFVGADLQRMGVISNMEIDKNLKKLSKAELIQMLNEETKKNEELTQENEQLKNELTEAKEKLSSREIILDEAGSIAEASLAVNNIFEVAHDSAQLYLENIEKLSKRQEEVSAKREKECEDKCAAREQECEEKCATREKECEDKCAAREKEMRERCDRKTQECEDKVRRILNETAKYCKEVRRVVEGE